MDIQPRVRAVAANGRSDDHLGAGLRGAAASEFDLHIVDAASPPRGNENK